MASTIRIVSTVAAATTVANALAGNRFEFLPRTSHVAIYAIYHLGGDSTSIVGITASDSVLATVSFGNVVLLDAGAVVASVVGIQRSDHLLVGGVADGGDRLIISLQNTDAAQVADVVLMLEITDL